MSEGIVKFEADKQKRINDKANELLKEIAMVVQDSADENKISDPTWLIMNSQLITMTVVQHMIDKTNKFNELFVEMVNKDASDEDMTQKKQGNDKRHSRGYQ